MIAPGRVTASALALVIALAALVGVVTLAYLVS
jgi:hypothetical protein